MEDLCLSSHLGLINSFDSAGMGPRPIKIILSGPGPKFSDPMGSNGMTKSKYNEIYSESDFLFQFNVLYENT